MDGWMTTLMGVWMGVWMKADGYMDNFIMDCLMDRKINSNFLEILKQSLGS